MAVIFSFFALSISVFSLGWNVYRDVILKARLRVRFNFSRIITPDTVGNPYLGLSIVNLGPGSVVCEMPVVRTKPRLRILFGKTKFGTLIHDYTNPLCAKPPFNLAVAEEAQVIVPITDISFMDGELFGICIADSFGRLHWAPMKDIYEARKRLREFRRSRPTN